MQSNSNPCSCRNFSSTAPSFLNDNLSNNDCLCRSQHDSPRFVCFQHGPRCLRYDGRKEAWRASTTSEINQPAMIPPTITLYSRAGGNRFWNFLFLAQSRMAGVFDAFHVGRFISPFGQSGSSTHRKINPEANKSNGFLVDSPN